MALAVLPAWLAEIDAAATLEAQQAMLLEVIRPVGARRMPRAGRRLLIRAATGHSRGKPV